MDTYAGYATRLGDLQSFSYGGSSYTITQPVVENRSAFQEKDDLVVTVARYASTRKRKGRFIGVRQKGGKWVAEIRDPAKKIRLWLGSFKSSEEAAVAYDLEARRIRGAKAHLNFPYGVPDVRLLLSARQTCYKTKRRHGKSWIKKAKEEEDKSEILSSRQDDDSPQGLQGHDDQGAKYSELAKSSACSMELNKDLLSDEGEEDILKIVLRLKEPDESFDMWNFEGNIT